MRRQDYERCFRRIVRAWNARYSDRAFVWMKTKATAPLPIIDCEHDLHVGMGFTTRKNTEECLLFPSTVRIRSGPAKPRSHNWIVSFGAPPAAPSRAILPVCTNQGAHHQMETTMNNAIQKSWEARRKKAIERFIGAGEAYVKSAAGDDAYDELIAALDAITVAHIAAKLERETGPAKNWADEAAKAMNRLGAAWECYKKTEDDPQAEERLNIALDALTIAHTAARFERQARILAVVPIL
jgi:hypothetical protein